VWAQCLRPHGRTGLRSEWHRDHDGNGGRVRQESDARTLQIELKRSAFRQSTTLPRAALILPRFTLLSTRLCCEPLVGFVALRTRGTSLAASTSACKRCIASA